MSANWSDGYFTEIGYTYGYYRELSPTMQRFCLLLRGIAAPESDSPAHCELGFGQGVSINVHAAATPGTYVGTDFNPEQAAFAMSLAQAAGSQARLYDDSFAQLLERDDLPCFDSISLHGIWSWINPENQATIVEFARRHLKPGGVFYVSYNCLPGWAGVAPLRQLFALHDRFSGNGRNASDRVGDAVDFATKLLEAKPRYASTIPGLSERLQKIAGQDRHYLAHEYFNQSWQVGYFTDVVDALAPAKLEFAAPAYALDGLDSLHVPAEGMSFLASLQNPIMREQARDYFVNTQFRRDLYVRGARRLSVSERNAALLVQRVVLCTPAEKIPNQLALPHGTATLSEQIYGPVAEALAANDYAPKTLRELAQAVSGKNVNPAQVVEAVTVLCSLGAASPCQSEDAARQQATPTRQLNGALMRHAQHHESVSVLASSVTGGGINIDRMAKLFLLGRIEGQPDLAQFAWRAVEAAGQRLRKGDAVLQTPEENLAELRQRLQDFERLQLPLLKAHGIA